MTVAEMAFYPAVALLYFFGVLRASRQDRVELDERASVNVFVLFVLAQPLCLAFGGAKGLAAYLVAALVSYAVLPWKAAAAGTGDRDGNEEEEKKKN